MTCPACHHDTDTDGLCQRCTSRVTRQLHDLPDLWTEAHTCLQPQRGTGNTASREHTLGINLTALDWIGGRPILDLLHEWERLIRDERHLTPPALVAPAGSIAREIRNTIAFHLAHLDWTTRQPWAGDYVREIGELHSHGWNAARRDRDNSKRIPCPTTLDDGTYCGQRLPVSSDLNEDITCRRCRTTWTGGRLVHVAMSTPDQPVWVDAEAIATWYDISDRQVRRIAQKNNLERRGPLINLTAFRRVYVNSN